MSSTPDQLLHAGLARHRAGDPRGAAQFYQAVLQRAPRHAEALHLLGLVHAQAGDVAGAKDLIARALAIAPGHAEAHYNLGNLLRQSGEPAAAIASWRRALALDPTLVKAHYNLGSALHQAGEIDAAVTAYRAVLHMQPRHADAQANLGAALMQLRRPREALAPLQAALQLNPDADAQIALSGCLIALGGFASARAAAEAAIRLAPDSARAWQAYGQALHELGHAEPALAAFARAVALAPQSPEPLVALAGAQQDHGLGAAAAQSVAQALALDPGHSFAWALRAGLTRLTPDDIAQLEALAGTVTGEDRTRIAFALAKGLMDAGAHDAAFLWLGRANAHHRAGISYDLAADLARLIPALPARATAIEARPIFVVGMPRSGTTLVEQILASHPAVHGGGEMKHLDIALMEHFGGPADPARIAALDAPTLDRLAQTYLARAGAGVAPGLRITDKMPSNFRHAGLIHRLFPQAVIVHCRRDPRDTCLSIYATHFAAGQDFAYDLRELGAYYRGYRDLMAQWRQVLPLVEVDYEVLVADPESETRRLVAACGLPWDPACLAFHRTARSVRTASVNQVRRPLYATSVERWRPYADYLEPLGL